MPTATTAIFTNTVMRASLAYVYSFIIMVNLILMSQNINDPTKVPMNQMFYMNGTATPEYSPIIGPNVDAIYGVAWIDLTNTNMYLTTADTRHMNRWVCAQILDYYANTITNVPNVDKNAASKTYLLVGPNYSGYHDPRMIRCPTNLISIYVRVMVLGGDIAAAEAVLHQFTISPTNSSAVTFSTPALDNTLYTNPDLQYFVDAMTVLDYITWPSDEQVLIDQFSEIGLNPTLPFIPADLTLNQVNAFNQAINQSYYYIIPFGNVYSLDLRSSNNFNGGAALGSYGDTYTRRAYVGYIGGEQANFASQQFYMSAYQDVTGALLNGASHNYNIHYPAGTTPGVNPTFGQWTYNMYYLSNTTLVYNDYGIYGVGTNTGLLHYNTDGSLDIPISNIAPNSTVSGWQNFLPASLTNFLLILRMYSVTETQLDDVSNIPGVMVVG